MYVHVIIIELCIVALYGIDDHSPAAAVVVIVVVVAIVLFLNWKRRHEMYFLKDERIRGYIASI